MTASTDGGHRTQAVRSALSRAGLGRQGRPRDRAGAGRRLLRNRTRPRGADAPAGGPGAGASPRSRSIAIWRRRFARPRPPNLTVVDGRLPASREWILREPPRPARSGSPAISPTTSRRRSCSSWSSSTAPAFRSSTRRSCCSARSPTGSSRGRARGSTACSASSIQLVGRRRAAAGAAARRLPAGAEGPVGGRPAPVSPARLRRRGTPTTFARAGPGRLHPAAENARERAARLPALGSGGRIRRRCAGPASTAGAGPRRWTVAELVRLADAATPRRFATSRRWSCAIVSAGKLFS